MLPQSGPGEWLRGPRVEEASAGGHTIHRGGPRWDGSGRPFRSWSGRAARAWREQPLLSERADGRWEIPAGRPGSPSRLRRGCSSRGSRCVDSGGRRGEGV